MIRRRKTKAQTVVADYRKTLVRQARETIGSLTVLLGSTDQCLDQHGSFPISTIDIVDLCRRLDVLHAQHNVLSCVEIELKCRAKYPTAFSRPKKKKKKKS